MATLPANDVGAFITSSGQAPTPSDPGTESGVIDPDAAALRDEGTLYAGGSVAKVQPTNKKALLALPNYNSEFIKPASGVNQGILGTDNSITIVNSCGTKVVAAAEGLVVPDNTIVNTLNGWNDGYGNFVLIEHPFGSGIATRYSHLEQVSVQPGDYVQQGQAVGLMGQTGDATGCSLNFQVIGARNPFAKK